MTRSHKILLALVIFLIASFSLYAFRVKAPGIQPDEMAACTQEGLLCPDGTAVGRGGSQCTFAACANQSPYEGTLEQDANGFFVLLSSPGYAGGNAYRMPIAIRVSNVLDQFVGKKVRVTGAFSEGSTFAVDQLEEVSAQ